MIAAPDHLARRGMNPAVRPQEQHADAETKAGPDTASLRLPVVPLDLRRWNRGTGRDISLPAANSSRYGFFVYQSHMSPEFTDEL